MGELIDLEKSAAADSGSPAQAVTNPNDKELQQLGFVATGLKIQQVKVLVLLLAMIVNGISFVVLMILEQEQQLRRGIQTSGQTQGAGADFVFYCVASLVLLQLAIGFVAACFCSRIPESAGNGSLLFIAFFLEVLAILLRYVPLQDPIMVLLLIFCQFVCLCIAFIISLEFVLRTCKYINDALAARFAKGAIRMIYVIGLAHAAILMLSVYFLDSQRKKVDVKTLGELKLMGNVLTIIIGVMILVFFIQYMFALSKARRAIASFVNAARAG